MKRAKKIVAALLLTSSLALGLVVTDINNTSRGASSVLAHDPGGGGN